ncbi:unnamed protein product [Blepharisma stoltei]|uniref:Uncharacterized protein n=1 Tax=Blepharisma stoltei TaxID=1481888 RepID=A0AAU9JHL7_9CILI|nr:unnamed protein product [Blepharisma stoltei]
MEKRGEFSARGNNFLFCLYIGDDTLKVEFEEKETAKKWLGDFTAQYIETMTQKTNNFKKFPTFVKMLISALEKNSESVMLDIYTVQELDILKNSRRPQGNQAPIDPKLSMKRYMILTYLVEFDKVHYPLPLLYQEAPDIDALQRTIIRLRNEIDQYKQNLPEGDLLKIIEENQEIKQKIKKIEHNQALAAVPRKGAVEIDTLIKESKALEEENDILKLEGSKEAKILRKKNEDLQVEFDRIKSEMEIIISQLEEENEEKLEIRNIKIKVENLEEELEKAKIQENQAKETLFQSQEELDKLKESDRKQKMRIKELENELQSVLRARSSRGSSPVPSKTYGVNNRLNRSPASRSPGSAGRFSPKSSQGSSRSNSRPGSDRVAQRNSPGYRNRSPGASPASSINRRINSPGNQQRTPPGRRDSPGNRKSSPALQYSPNAGARRNNRTTEEEKPIRKKSPKANGADVSDIDARLARLQELLKRQKA